MVEVSPSPARVGSGTIQTVQLLRAIAALFVVGFHSTVLWADKSGSRGHVWNNGASGVDLFFVISGFIMLVSTRSLARRADGWRHFLILRLVRIAPMYWLATIAKLAAIAAVPALERHTRTTTWNTVASFLFIPSRDATGVIRPVLDVGWTLSLEMFFYLIFAVALFFEFDPPIVVLPAMCVLAALSGFRNVQSPAIFALCDPIVLEFAAGLIVARLWMKVSLARIPTLAMIAIGAAGMLCLWLAPAFNPFERALVFGSAATATLASAVSLERIVGPHIPKFFLSVGEASYSLYLTHGFVLPLVGIAVAKTRLTGTMLGLAIVVACLIASTALALACYRLVERPITDWLRELTRERFQAKVPT
jgi:exopolysaccharide production protein ExoZ